jgi:hypothetical protein
MGTLTDHIVRDEEICGGEPRIRGPELRCGRSLNPSDSIMQRKPCYRPSPTSRLRISMLLLCTMSSIREKSNDTFEYR